MQENRIVKIDGFEVPVLISDEKEALLAAKAAGRALIGLWQMGESMESLAGARYVIQDVEDATEEYVERIARRHLGLSWNICETERLLIREMMPADFALICENKIGPGLETFEELQTYVKHQYDFYEFGFWALVEKATGKLVGAAGLLVPNPEHDSLHDGEPNELETVDGQNGGIAMPNMTVLYAEDIGLDHSKSHDSPGFSEMLELGYHIFPDYRRRGYAKEACGAIMEYGREYLGVTRFVVRIDKENEASLKLAGELGFKARNQHA